MDTITVDEAIDRLADCGIVAMYGGGDESKGHGFWLRQTNPEDAKRRAAWWRQARSMTNEQYTAERRHWDEGAPLVNDGEKSGNPHFWMFEDALALTAEPTPCQHPPARLYAWGAGGVLCVGCCECGQVLAGAAS